MIVNEERTPFMDNPKCDKERDLELNINMGHNYGMSVMMNVDVVEQEECERKNECEVREPFSGEVCKPAAEDVRKTTFSMEEEKECAWGKKGMCKTHNAGRKVCKTFNEWKLKRNGLYGYERRQKTTYICMMGVGHNRDDSSSSSI